MGEELVMHWGQVYNFPALSLLFFNVYGPRSRTSGTYGAVFGVFLAQKLARNPFTVVGNGEQTRSFCFIDDLVLGLQKMMSSAKENIGPINLGNPTELKILDLAKKIIKLTNYKSKIINKDLQLDDPIRRKPDISEAKKILNWDPKVDIDDGLKETIEYFKLQLK